MEKVQHKWFSPNIGRELSLNVYGKKGIPVVVFPPQEGCFHDFEDFGMVEVCRPFIDDHRLVLYSVDGIDKESWANWSAEPSERAKRHECYDKYIVSEVIAFIRDQQGELYQPPLTTGCSMGGYHAANFYFRHPDVFSGTICLSGILDVELFVGKYMDETVYFNSPLHYLRNLRDSYYLDLYRNAFMVIGLGRGSWQEEMISDAEQMEVLAREKDIPVWVDIWGYDVAHDWPWWKKQLPYYLEVYFRKHSIEPK